MSGNRHAHRESGFTLIELVISLGLFALIAVAGLALVEGVLGVQDRTEGRLDRLADLQRAMLVVSGDLAQVAPGDIAGEGGRLSFARTAPGLGGAAVATRYEAAGGALVRVTGVAPQLVLSGVSGARWRFFDADGWADRWPPSEEARARWPRAIALELQVAGRPGASGALRRVVLLPARPQDEERPQ